MAKQSATELLRKYADIVSESSEKVVENTEHQTKALFQKLHRAAYDQDINTAARMVKEIQALGNYSGNIDTDFSGASVGTDTPGY